MLNGKRLVVVMPSYNAAKTLVKTVADVPRDIVDEAVRLLRIGGVFIMEHGDLQGEALRAFAESSVYWEGVTTLKDLTGRDRMLVARRIGA